MTLHLSAKVLLAVCTVAASSHAMAQTQVYMAAHQDDVPLFMGHQAWNDLTSNKPCVFIFTTAGDAGMKNGGWGSLPYFRAREEASIQGLRLPTSQIVQWFPEDTATTLTINNRKVRVVTHRNTVTYFLRLPDGAPNGEGFADTGFMSLKRLRAGLVRNMKTVEGATTYANWSTLVGTVRAILQRHGTGQTINVHDYDESINGGTHSDHAVTGILAAEASTGLASLMRYWIDYESRNREPNMTDEQKSDKFAVYGSYMAMMSRYGYNFGYDYGHKNYLSRGYFREVIP